MRKSINGRRIYSDDTRRHEAATTTRSATIEAAIGRDGHEIFSWQAALPSQRRSQVCFFLLLRPCHRARPGSSVFDESLNNMADDNTSSKFYLYGSISPTVGGDGGDGSSGGVSGGRKQVIFRNFEPRTKS